MNNFRSNFLDSIPPIVKNLIIINVIMWLATEVSPTIFGRLGIDGKLSDFFGLHYWASSEFNIIQFITYIFMHGGFTHLFFNMFSLYMFGGLLEQLWGPKRFLFYYLVTGVGAGIVQQLFWTVEFQPVVTALNQAMSSNSGEALLPISEFLSRYMDITNLTAIVTPQILELKQALYNAPITVGASGSVFGLLLAFGWLFPDLKLMLLFFPVPIKAKYFVFMYGIAELFLGVARFSGDNIAHFAHLGGMLFGIILILYWKKKRQL
ncbi:MAG: rhomboid family intramembrane serine protease [Paludibacter sp.]|nr:rhomboid family intramembrane serine protease [Paludibacter sp.]